MKIFRRALLIVLVIIVQWFVVVALTAHSVNLAKVPYRQVERKASWDAVSRDPSPENKAAFEQELRLAAHHEGK